MFFNFYRAQFTIVLVCCFCYLQTVQAMNTSSKAVVEVYSVKKQDVPINFEYVGEVEASREIEVRTRITGIIEKRLFQEGQRVKQGDILFKLDDKLYQAQLDQARAALAVARASKVNAETEYNKAKRDYARIAPLTSKELISQSDLDNAQSAIDLAKSAIAKADASILEAKALIKSRQINVDYTRVRSPIDGISGLAEKSEGNLVESGSNSQSLLTRIAQLHPAYVNFSVPEKEITQRKQDIFSGYLVIPEQGYQVRIKTGGGQWLKQIGSIHFQDYQVEPSTGTFFVRAIIDNKDADLSPGQFVRVVLDGAYRPNVFVLPQKAVMDGTAGKYVYVAENNEQGVLTAVVKNIEVGEWIEKTDQFSQAWIVKSGLNDGDKVVVNGMARIFYPGMPLTTTNQQDNISKR